jgi:hypothetical protein
VAIVVPHLSCAETMRLQLRSYVAQAAAALRALLPAPVYRSSLCFATIRCGWRRLICAVYPFVVGSIPARGVCETTT